MVIRCIFIISFLIHKQADKNQLNISKKSFYNSKNNQIFAANFVKTLFI